MTKPNRQFNDIIQSGLKAHQLALRHGLGERLPAGMLDGLTADIATLGTLVSGAGKSRDEAKTATKTLKDALAYAYDQLRAIRALVAGGSAPQSVRSAYAIGQKVNPTVVASVDKAIRRVVERVDAKPEEARSFGILDADVESLRATLTRIAVEDDAQERRIASIPAKTQDRNLAARRVLAAVRRIAASGMLQFPADERGKDFGALLRGPGRPKADPEREAKETKPAAA